MQVKSLLKQLINALVILDSHDQQLDYSAAFKGSFTVKQTQTHTHTHKENKQTHNDLDQSKYQGITQVYHHTTSSILPTLRVHWGYISGTLPIYIVGTKGSQVHHQTMTSILPTVWVPCTSDSQVHHQTMTSILPTLWVPVLQVCHQTMTTEYSPLYCRYLRIIT